MALDERYAVGQPIPVHTGGRSSETCRWRCGNQCFHETPNTSDDETFHEVLAAALSRRGFLKWGTASVVMVAASGPLAAAAKTDGVATSRSGAIHPGRGHGLTFTPIQLSTADQVIVPDGYGAAPVVRWGDPLLSGAPSFDLAAQTPDAQSRQFGYNCDFVTFIPIRGHGRDRHGTPHVPFRGDHGVLVINHEYTNPELMFPDYIAGTPTQDQVDIELAAHGLSVVEVRRDRRGPWVYVPGSWRNRRITAETPIEISGPAAGHELLMTTEDPSGSSVRGMLNNCAAGTTPWGTVLTCEENFNQYFANLASMPADDPRVAMHTRYGLTTAATQRLWEQFHDRFDLTKEPNEPFRFGWVVEVDPFDPSWTPKKRTALGRMKHEAATTALTRDRRAAVYMGDDERFEYVYKFVSAGHVRLFGRRSDRDLLDEGTLFVARFDVDGTGAWIPVVQGTGPLTAENGFETQADVLINTRSAAGLLGATKMDRPEDIERDPATGVVYCVMTNNTSRGTAGNPGTDPANPRTPNRHGHVIELAEDGGDAGALTFSWQIFMLCGDPADTATQTYFAGFDPSLVSPISCPDNITFDRSGNLWIATDGQGGTFGAGDGIYAVPVHGDERGYVRQFLSGPIGAELCGPAFAPDGETFFCAIQHPGEGGTLAAPISTWPDGQQPTRPSVVAVSRLDGGPVGG